MRGIAKRFGAVVANDGVDFVARFGEVHALVGENGAGKSTLMSILAGLYRPDAGSLAIDGEPVALQSPKDATERGIGMVYQHFMLVESFTVAENVMLGQTDPGIRLETRAVERDLRDLARRYHLDVDPTARIWQLSVGEQQRVEIIRLLYRGARILIFDEPTAVLTPQESESLLRTFRAMAAEGFCVIFISHKLHEVFAVADRITVLRRGRTVATTVTSATDRRSLASLMVGRELARALLDEGPPSEHASGAVMLAVSDLHAAGDKGPAALNGVSFDVRAGEILGVAGVAGNGQRELAEVLTGLRPATAGRIAIDGSDLSGKSPAAIARAGVAHIPEDRIGTGLARGLDLAGNAILRSYRRPPVARGPFLIGRAIAAFADRLIQNGNVQPADRRARLRDLSGGNQQKLLLARELDGSPKLLVAVHPTRGVDVGATEAIHAAIAAQRASGSAILLISEDLDELLHLSDRIAVLYDGRLMGVVSAAGADLDEIGHMMAGGQTEAVPA